MDEYKWVIVDDWQGLYKNDKLVMEGHSFHPRFFADELDIGLYNYVEEFENYAMEHGRFPDDFSELEALLNGN